MAAVYERAAGKAYSRLLGNSFAQLTGRPLLQGIDPTAPDFARALYNMPHPLVSHGTEADPIFRYANRAALALWEMDWDAFTNLPSRHSAQDDPSIQTDRSRYLNEAAARGWVADYTGIRVSATGHRFRIAETILWTVTDPSGTIHGQAALIGRVDRL